MDTGLMSETPWETRNLGTPSYALNIEKLIPNDEVLLQREIAYLRSQHASFFIFARISKKDLNLSSVLGRAGFYMVECTICPYIKLQSNHTLQSFEQNRQPFLPAKFNGTDVAVVSFAGRKELPAASIKTIAAESFTDDRIHLDPNCPKETADRRFSYWVDDLMSDSGVIFDLLMVRDSIGGFLARKGNNLILAGFSQKYKKAGLGDYLWLHSCLQLKEQAFATAETLISINNVPVLNLYSRLGFKFKDAQYSFHFWHK